ncbi:DNA repair protein RadA [Ectothiorhodospiraceae bacterium BW-2]|nr:DNA repair protein RadA [Ectothiorhodospiraceae bacterium BW-2]
MAKAKLQYSCRECGAISPKWAGQCGDCGAWNSMGEELAPVTTAAAVKPRFGGYAGAGQTGAAAIIELNAVESEAVERDSVGIGEFDRVLGGGLVPGSVVLLGGDPGIGKSTLLLQVLDKLSDRFAVLYMSGEESPQQVSLRARRLQLAAKSVRILAETRVEAILHACYQEQPRVLVIDSVQTIYSEMLSSAPGSVSQVRESCAKLVQFAKQTQTGLFLVGHVTKEGQLAGPRVLEHMVDTVLYFEGDSGSRYRVIRAVKNRFGAVNELGVFAMTEAGLKAITNPSAIFLANRDPDSSGSVVMVTVEGSRPLLVEVQALVDESHGSAPRRLAVGLDVNRLMLLLAVLHRHGGIATFDQDIFINVVGGVKLNETAVDLALLAAIWSSLRDRPLPQTLIIFGEVGLGGEIRPVPNGQERLREAAKHGFTRAIIPYANRSRQVVEGLQVETVKRIDELFERL